MLAGYCNEKNRNIAHLFYLMAASKNNDCESHYRMGNYYKEESEKEKSILYFEKCFSNIVKYSSLSPSEKLCVSNSINNLMDFYEDKKDFCKIIFMLRKASFYGHKSSTEFLGLFYYEVEDYYEAKHFLQLCVNQISSKLRMYFSELLHNCLIQLNL
jgi:tetratricopeptide (TPR) repeat protein